MNSRRALQTLGVIAMTTLLSSQSLAQKIVVAHRGASGYLPEHTLEAKAMAYAMGADYIEQDVVMTADEQLIVLHDITLDRTTDVADQFPSQTIVIKLIKSAYCRYSTFAPCSNGLKCKFFFAAPCSQQLDLTTPTNCINSSSYSREKDCLSYQCSMFLSYEI